MNPIHIVTEKENIKENVLLPGDPLRAQYIAEKYQMRLNSYCILTIISNKDSNKRRE